MEFLNTFLPVSLVRFIMRRLDNTSLSGLPLTLLVATVVYLLFIFFGIIQNIITSNIIIAMDTRVANFLFAIRGTEFTKFFTWLTLLAVGQIILVFAVIYSIILFLWKKKTYLLPLWITIAGSELFTYLVKLAIHRPRPLNAIYTENSFSFPSGHASISVVFYGFIAYILFRQLKKWQHKMAVLFFGVIFILMIGLSRLYLGVHFLSDVLGGYLLGTLWLLIGIAIFERLQNYER